MKKEHFDGVDKVLIMGAGESTIYTRLEDGNWSYTYCDSFGNCEDMGAVGLDVVRKELSTYAKIYRRKIEKSVKSGLKVLSVHQ